MPYNLVFSVGFDGERSTDIVYTLVVGEPIQVKLEVSAFQADIETDVTIRALTTSKVYYRWKCPA